MGKSKKKSLVKPVAITELILAILCACSQVASYILNINFSQNATKMELLRLKGEVTYAEAAVSGRLVSIVSGMSSFFLVAALLGILVLIGVVLYENIKKSSNRK